MVTSRDKQNKADLVVLFSVDQTDIPFTSLVMSMTEQGICMNSV